VISRGRVVIEYFDIEEMCEGVQLLTRKW